MSETRAGAGTLVTRGDRVLMVLRERSGLVRWELPSGLLGSGESFEEAATRETFEETGIDVEIGELLCTATMIVPIEEYRAVNVYFRATAGNDQQPQILTRSEPIKEVAFAEIAQLDPSQIHPVDRQILHRWRRSPRQRPFCFTIDL